MPKSGSLGSVRGAGRNACPYREKSSKIVGMLVAAACAATVGSIAVADDSGWYVGANAGQSRAKIDDLRIVNELAEAGIDTTETRDDDRHFGYKLFGGYQFIRYFALEGGYFDLGRFGYTADTAPPAGVTGKARLNGMNLDAVGILPFTDRLSAFGRVGVDYAYAKDQLAGYGDVVVKDPERSEHGANYKFGAGLQFALTGSLAMRAEAERYRVDDGVGNKGDIDLFSAGLVYRFGHAVPPPQPAAPMPPPPLSAPEPVAAAPATPSAPPPPIRRQVSFSADSLFDFGKETVRPEGKRALDDFAAELNGAQFDTIKVTGYTDRIGSRDYNLKLSTRRAEEVKRYLVESAAIPQDKVTVEGADGSNPITKPEECTGVRRTPRLIACLQPDRRVDVEVVGSKAQSVPLRP